MNLGSLMGLRSKLVYAESETNVKSKLRIRSLIGQAHGLVGTKLENAAGIRANHKIPNLKDTNKLLFF